MDIQFSAGLGGTNVFLHKYKESNAAEMGMLRCLSDSVRDYFILGGVQVIITENRGIHFTPVGHIFWG